MPVRVESCWNARGRLCRILSARPSVLWKSARWSFPIAFRTAENLDRNVIDASESRVVLERTGKALPYSVRKAVRFVEECALEFSYCVQNRGEFPMRYMWSAHPLISVDGPYELRLPAGDLHFRTFPSDGEDHAWPIFASRNLSREWIPRETDLKVFITGFT